MKQNTDAPAEAQTPVTNATIEAVSERHKVSEADVRTLLDRVEADIQNADLVAEFDDYHDLKGEHNGVRVYLCEHGLEVSELAEWAAEEIDTEFGEHVRPTALVTMAFDRDLRERHASVVGGRQEAVGATGTMDALLTSADE
jgi:phytoene/squalene synthetase